MVRERGVAEVAVDAPAWVLGVRACRGGVGLLARGEWSGSWDVSTVGGHVGGRSEGVRSVFCASWVGFVHAIALRAKACLPI